MSKNSITIEQLNLACRQFEEMLSLGVSENFAIRQLELFANSYAKFHVVGNVSPDHVDHYMLWSEAALALRQSNPNCQKEGLLRVEHGTPRRQFARIIYQRWKSAGISEAWMAQTIQELWKVAVITAEEDRRLNKTARSTLFDSPFDRWRSSGIEVRDVAQGSDCATYIVDGSKR
jgi:hypothetical protein